jgi:hypothetical protein
MTLPCHAANRLVGPGLLRCVACLALLATLAALLIPTPVRATAAPAQSAPPGAQSDVVAGVLSPYWEPGIQRWADTIGALAEAYGFHPDFVAAVIKHESDDEFQAISRRGAVGLMDIMADEAVLEWRPSSETLLTPTADLRWGLAILSYVVQQAGGDLYTALAAYNGGWQHVNSRIPREYAARVLDSYARALLARAGLPAEMAARWTVAVDIRAGNVPDEALLVLGYEPIAELRTLAPHTVYAFADGAGRTYYVRATVVPVGLTAMVAGESGLENPDELEAPLRARLGEKSAGSAAGNPRVLLACLAGLTRLRGQVTTRWYGPSGCPASGR